VAVTEEPLDELKDDEGVQLYVLAPPAVSVMFCPVQMLAFGVTVTTGKEFTVTVTCAVDVQPLMSPVTVYVVVDVGLAVTEEPVDELKDDEGVQLYVLAPPAVSVMFCPVQMAAFGVTVTTGNGFTVTVTCAVEVQPLMSPVTV